MFVCQGDQKPVGPHSFDSIEYPSCDRFGIPETDCAVHVIVVVHQFYVLSLPVLMVNQAIELYSVVACRSRNYIRTSLASTLTDPGCSGL